MLDLASTSTLHDLLLSTKNISFCINSLSTSNIISPVLILADINPHYTLHSSSSVKTTLSIEQHRPSAAVVHHRKFHCQRLLGAASRLLRAFGIHHLGIDQVKGRNCGGHFPGQVEYLGQTVSKSKSGEGWHCWALGPTRSC